MTLREAANTPRKYFDMKVTLGTVLVLLGMAAAQWKYSNESSARAQKLDDQMIALQVQLTSFSTGMAANIAIVKEKRDEQIFALHSQLTEIRGEIRDIRAAIDNVRTRRGGFLTPVLPPLPPPDNAPVAGHAG